jgi:hypothetical protein
VADRIEFYVALEFDGLTLLIAQHEIRFVEVIEDVQTQLEAGEAAVGVAGWLTHGEEQFPVFCLSYDLELINDLPKESRYCVILETEGQEATFGLICHNMESLSPRYPLHIQAIPEAMYNPDSPLDNLALYQGGIACLSNALSLVSYISAWGERRLEELDEDAVMVNGRTF